MRFLAAYITALIVFTAPVLAANMPIKHNKTRACGDFCRYLDGHTEQCALTDWPTYDKEGECSCEPNPACSGK
jgi:hypothetical protein